MSADPDGPHTKISHRLALELLSNPSPSSKLNALEYLFADYPDAGDSWINPFSKYGITMETSYCGYLAQVLRRKRSEDLKKAMIMKKMQAEEKLANLSQSEDLPV